MVAAAGQEAKTVLDCWKCWRHFAAEEQNEVSEGKGEESNRNCLDTRESG